MWILFALLIDSEKLNCIDFFKTIVSLTALLNPLESFNSINHEKRLTILNENILEKRLVGHASYTYQDFSQDLLNAQKAINNGELTELVGLNLERTLMTSQRHIDLRPEDKLKIALLFLKNKNNEIAIDMIKEIVSPLPTEYLSWPDHLKWICTQLESLKVLASFKEERTFVKNLLGEMSLVSTLTARDQLNLARLYLVVEDKKSALDILKNLRFSNTYYLIEDEVHGILKEFE